MKNRSTDKRRSVFESIMIITVVVITVTFTVVGYIGLVAYVVVSGG